MEKKRGIISNCNESALMKFLNEEGYRGLLPSREVYERDGKCIIWVDDDGSLRLAPLDYKDLFDIVDKCFSQLEMGSLLLFSLRVGENAPYQSYFRKVEEVSICEEDVKVLLEDGTTLYLPKNCKRKVLTCNIVVEM